MFFGIFITIGILLLYRWIIYLNLTDEKENNFELGELLKSREINDSTIAFPGATARITVVEALVSYQKRTLWHEIPKREKNFERIVFIIILLLLPAGIAGLIKIIPGSGLLGASPDINVQVFGQLGGWSCYTGLGLMFLFFWIISGFIVWIFLPLSIYDKIKHRISIYFQIFLIFGLLILGGGLYFIATQLPILSIWGIWVALFGDFLALIALVKLLNP